MRDRFLRTERNMWSTQDYLRANATVFVCQLVCTDGKVCLHRDENQIKSRLPGKNTVIFINVSDVCMILNGFRYHQKARFIDTERAC